MNPDCIRLHSAYNPVREAERFASAAIPELTPGVVVVTEPGESYLAEVLRNRYPSTRIIAIRYTKNLFTESDSVWDAVWRPGGRHSLLDFLYRTIPDEYLPITVFLSWKAAEKYWPDIYSNVWNEIARLVRLQSGIIRTRNHFGKSWLRNTVFNAVFAQNPVTLPSLTGSIFLACAGPSLEKSFPVNPSRYVIASVSSALSCLIAHRIEPDICISTDGGYWVRDYFKFCPSRTTVVVPAEAAVPDTILRENPVQFLSYATSLEKTLYSLTGIKPVAAERNGTVAGTAVRFLLDSGNGSVLAAGLDLENDGSYSHARPHAFDSLIDVMSGRTQPLSSVLYERASNGMALEAYARWFRDNAHSFSGRLSRIGTSLRPIHGIPQIDLTSPFPGTMEHKRPDPVIQHVVSSQERARLVATCLEDRAHELKNSRDVLHTDPVISELFQLVSFSEYLSFIKTGDSEVLRAQTAGYLEELAEKVRKRGR